jgi:hypothetical protein
MCYLLNKFRRRVFVRGVVIERVTIVIGNWRKRWKIK